MLHKAEVRGEFLQEVGVPEPPVVPQLLCHIGALVRLALHPSQALPEPLARLPLRRCRHFNLPQQACRCAGALLGRYARRIIALLIASLWKGEFVAFRRERGPLLGLVGSRGVRRSFRFALKRRCVIRLRLLLIVGVGEEVLCHAVG